MGLSIGPRSFQAYPHLPPRSSAASRAPPSRWPRLSSPGNHAGQADRPHDARPPPTKIVDGLRRPAAYAPCARKCAAGPSMPNSGAVGMEAAGVWAQRSPGSCCAGSRARGPPPPSARSSSPAARACVRCLLAHATRSAARPSTGSTASSACSRRRRSSSTTTRRRAGAPRHGRHTSMACARPSGGGARAATVPDMSRAYVATPASARPVVAGGDVRDVDFVIAPR